MQVKTKVTAKLDITISRTAMLEFRNGITEEERQELEKMLKDACEEAIKKHSCVFANSSNHLDKLYNVIDGKVKDFHFNTL